jgi:hypothetical protein
MFERMPAPHDHGASRLLALVRNLDAHLASGAVPAMPRVPNGHVFTDIEFPRCWDCDSELLNSGECPTCNYRDDYEAEEATMSAPIEPTPCDDTHGWHGECSGCGNTTCTCDPEPCPDCGGYGDCTCFDTGEGVDAAPLLTPEQEQAQMTLNSRMWASKLGGLHCMAVCCDVAYSPLLEAYTTSSAFGREWLATYLLAGVRAPMILVIPSTGKTVRVASILNNDSEV